jgi:hypothetical protein
VKQGAARSSGLTNAMALELFLKADINQQMLLLQT